jgi:hypothetical protein
MIAKIILRTLFKGDRDRQEINKFPNNNFQIINFPIHSKLNHQLRWIKIFQISNFTLIKCKIHLIFMLQIRFRLISLANNKFKKKLLKTINYFNKILAYKIKLNNHRQHKFKKNHSQNNYPSFLKIRKTRIKWMLTPKTRTIYSNNLEIQYLKLITNLWV